MILCPNKTSMFSLFACSASPCVRNLPRVCVAAAFRGSKVILDYVCHACGQLSQQAHTIRKDQHILFRCSPFGRKVSIALYSQAVSVIR